MPSHTFKRGSANVTVPGASADHAELARIELDIDDLENADHCDPIAADIALSTLYDQRSAVLDRILAAAVITRADFFK